MKDVEMQQITRGRTALPKLQNVANTNKKNILTGNVNRLVASMLSENSADRGGENVTLLGEVVFSVEHKLTETVDLN